MKAVLALKVIYIFEIKTAMPGVFLSPVEPFDNLAEHFRIIAGWEMTKALELLHQLVGARKCGQGRGEKRNAADQCTKQPGHESGSCWIFAKIADVYEMVNGL